MNFRWHNCKLGPVTKLRAVISAFSSSPDETAQLAAGLADLATPGDLLVLVGDLGAGKTAFSKAYGAALGVDEPMTSPTFTIAREYEGRLPLHHLDVYRLEQMAEVLDRPSGLARIGRRRVDRVGRCDHSDVARRLPRSSLYVW